MCGEVMSQYTAKFSCGAQTSFLESERPRKRGYYRAIYYNMPTEVGEWFNAGLGAITLMTPTVVYLVS